MMPIALTPLVASPPDPTAAGLPANIAALLHAVPVLLGYGRHMLDTVGQRSTAPNFEAIAACFGTAKLSTILAHLNRGILRCIVLERVLLARAASGHDIDFAERCTRTPQERPAAQPEQQTAASRLRRAQRPAYWDDPELVMPDEDDVERQLGRHPVGRILVDICLDLGVMPDFCHAAFWDELLELIDSFSAHVGKLMVVKARRREAFAKEQDDNPRANWGWLNMSRAALRRTLGFVIGETPVNPFGPAFATARPPLPYIPR